MPATETTKKRNAGNFVIEYVNKAGEAHSRIPAAVVGLKITDRKANKSKIYSFNDESMPEDVLISLAAAGYNRMFQTNIRNTIDKDNKENIDVFNVADKVQATLLSGKVYARTGNGTGKKSVKKKEFEVNLWTEVANKFLKDVNQLSDEAVARFLAKVEAIDPRSRVSKICNNPICAAAYRAVMASRAAQEAKKAKATGGVEQFDLDDFLSDTDTDTDE